MSGHDSFDRSGHTTSGGRGARPTYTLHRTPGHGGPAEAGVGRYVAADGEGRNVLLVTYAGDASPDAVVERHRSVFDPGGEMGVISIGEGSRSTAARSPSVPSSDAGVVTTVESPTDLVGLGLAMGTYLEGWSATDGHTVVWFRSLTTLLQHVGVETAFRFLRVFKRRLSELGAIAHFELDPAACHDDTVEPLTELFDRIVGEAPTDPEYAPAATPSADEDPGVEDLPPEAIRRVVSTPRRLRTLSILLEESGPVPVPELAERIARDRSFDGRASEEAVVDARVALTHNHLPLLERYGLVALYDGASRVESLDRARLLAERVDDDPAGGWIYPDAENGDLDTDEP